MKVPLGLKGLSVMGCLALLSLCYSGVPNEGLDYLSFFVKMVGLGSKGSCLFADRRGRATSPPLSTMELSSSFNEQCESLSLSKEGKAFIRSIFRLLEALLVIAELGGCTFYFCVDSLRLML